jgi:hypothetical protein
LSETIIEPEPVQPEPVQPEPIQPKPVQPKPHSPLGEEEGDQDQELIAQLRNLTVQPTNWADVDDDDFFETS